MLAVEFRRCRSGNDQGCLLPLTETAGTSEAMDDALLILLQKSFWRHLYNILDKYRYVPGWLWVYGFQICKTCLHA